MPDLQRAPMILFACLLFVWGYSWVLLKIGLEDCGPVTFAALRTFIGALALLAALPLLRRPFWPTRIRETLILGFAQTTIFVTLSQLSLVEGGAGRSAVLVYTMPFWTIIFAALFLGERVVGTQRWSVALAAVGLIAILEPWHLDGSVRSKVIAIAAGAAWAASAVIAKRIQNRGPIDLVGLTAWQMLFGAVILLAAVPFTGEMATDFNPRFVAILVFTALVPTGLGWLVWLYVLRRLSAGVASMSMLVIPVLATISSAIHLGERLSAIEYAGIALIVVALVLLSATAIAQQRALMRS